MLKNRGKVRDKEKLENKSSVRDQNKDEKHTDITL